MRHTPLELLALPEEELRLQAERITQEVSGNCVDLCAIINIRSGHCGMDCKFCIQNSCNAGFQGYPLLSNSDLKSRIEQVTATPVTHIGLVASGKALVGAEFDRLIKLVEILPAHIKRRLCASLGQLNASQLQRLKAVGVRRYHHNLETSPAFYPRVCSSQTWQARRATVIRAIGAGLEVCSGALFGLGESWRDRVDLALSLASLAIDNVPLNFLHPQPGTPYAHSHPLSAAEGLRIIALFRHILPKARLRVCGGRLITFGERQKEIFAAGANAMMTGDYLTTKGAGLDRDLQLLQSAGRTAQAWRPD